MATDYISREAASDLLAMALIDDWEPEYAQDRLSEIPAADVRENVKGQWTREVLGSTSGYGTTVMYRCSACKTLSINEYRFCPRCGADMKGEKNG